MKDQRLQIADIVRHIDDATQGILNVPEFQRRFVWRASKVAALVDSLWRGYPVGTLLLWESSYDSPRVALGGPAKTFWIVDGQQRVTSFAILFGKKPYWWDDARQWNTFYEKFDVLVNISRDLDALEFGLPNPIRRRSSDWVSVRAILRSDNLSELAMEISQRLGGHQYFAACHEKLQSIKRIETAPLYQIIVDHELEDVAEIFKRLNTAGTKIRESDIVVALIAAKQQGWIRQKFDPFLRDLESRGFDLDPSIIIRTLAIVGHGSARLRDVPQAFWEPSEHFDEHWRRTKEAIGAVLRSLMEHGILSSDLLPSLNVLIPVFVLRARFPNDFGFGKAFRWLLMATRDGRYGGSGTTVLDQDTRELRHATSFDRAIEDLFGRLSAQSSFTADDFLETYADKFMRLIYFLVAFDSEAKDWVNQDVRVGFDNEDNELNEGFRPEWHHVFPRKVLKDGFSEDQIDALANIVVLNQKANRSFSARLPARYLSEHNVSPNRLKEQSVPSGDALVLERYPQFLQERAERLAAEASEFLASLERR